MTPKVGSEDPQGSLLDINSLGPCGFLKNQMNLGDINYYQGYG